MDIIRTVEQLKKVVDKIKKENKSIGLVPTMGALHEGHLSLVNRAVKENDITIVSVFVNPTQFNNPQDLASYPRTEKEDTARLDAASVDYAFIPSVNEVYPEPDNRVFNLGQVAEVMEGAMRPGHFNGVAQIVSKLFDWTKPDKAYFGEKDFQQIAVIKSMVNNEGYTLQIVECPISRESDGLARSSRNTRLSAQQREIAPKIYETLNISRQWSKDGLSPRQVEQKVTEIINSIPGLDTEYFTIVDSATLLPIESWDTYKATSGSYPVGCITVYCGQVRLIDNIKYI